MIIHISNERFYQKTYFTGTHSFLVHSEKMTTTKGNCFIIQILNDKYFIKKKVKMHHLTVLIHSTIGKMYCLYRRKHLIFYISYFNIEHERFFF